MRWETGTSETHMATSHHKNYCDNSPAPEWWVPWDLFNGCILRGYWNRGGWINERLESIISIGQFGLHCVLVVHQVLTLQSNNVVLWSLHISKPEGGRSHKQKPLSVGGLQWLRCLNHVETSTGKLSIFITWASWWNSCQRNTVHEHNVSTVC